ncbi:DUF7537 family lipoprotein [Natronomonas sp. EA1]|uniref:DUF7537 family lipoprotein n=1 Tax=Natronomonas sp. EA1 TaxID=3421655 RepID=UPI003EBF099D
MRTTLAVVLLLLLAGCGSPFAEPTPTESVTPAPVPDDSTVAPGVTDAGLADLDALAGAHTTTLDARSYTVESTYRSVYPNGTERASYAVVVRLSADRDYRTNVSVTGETGPRLLGEPPATGEFWSNGSTYVAAITRGNDTTYSSYVPPDGYAGKWYYWTRSVALVGGPREDLVRTLEPFDELTRTGANATGHRLVGEAEALPSALGSGDLTDAHGARVEAIVTDRGVVRRYTLRYWGVTPAGEHVRVERTVVYRGIGRTTVEKPAWADRAQ